MEHVLLLVQPLCDWLPPALFEVLAQIATTKTLKKRQLVEMNQVSNVASEQQLLSTCSHPFLLKLAAAFQDTECLYMVLEFIQGGELYRYMQETEEGTLPLETSRFYTDALRCKTDEYMSEEEQLKLQLALEIAYQSRSTIGSDGSDRDERLRHAVAVGLVLADLRMEETAVCAALLAGVCEETGVTPDQIAGRLGPAVGSAVADVSQVWKLSTLLETSQADADAAQLEKRCQIMLAGCEDWRGVVVSSLAGGDRGGGELILVGFGAEEERGACRGEPAAPHVRVHALQHHRLVVLKALLRGSPLQLKIVN